MTAFDLETVFLSLSGSGAVTELPGAHFMERVMRSPADMVYLASMFPMTADWPNWERHPAGDEVLILLEGRVELVFDREGVETRRPFEAGQTVIVPAGVWHTAKVLEPGRMLGLTCGAGTEHRPA